ncbi:MAG: PEGA domain-containing protein [Lachnospiraceae bacterium]|nr:PEGA domain-containing protein [Lachnospiraceae bacterium]
MKKREFVRKIINGSVRLAGSVSLAAFIMFALTGCTPEAFNIGQAEEISTDEGTDLQSVISSGDTTVTPAQASSSSEAVVYTTYNYLPVGTYDSADTAILKSVDHEAHTVTLYNTIAAKSYTLNFDGTTYASDKYGTTMSMEQMTEGTIVNVNFYKANKQLVNIQVSPDAWTYEEVTRYDLGGINSTATIGDRTYALTKGVQVFSDGKQTDLMNIVDGDTITVSGIGSDIFSIKINSGHGYVRLTQDEALIGGWVEVGETLITKISEPGMLLTVPEGNYSVRMYNDNSSVTQEINVERNQEVVLDCSGVTAPIETIGSIIFHITPDTAVLSMDGEIKDTTGIVKAQYGVHEIEVSASGYDTLRRYVNVGTELAEITINLDETVSYTSGNSSLSYNLTGSGNSSSSNSSVSGNKASANSSSSNSSSSNSSSSNKSTVVTSKYNRVYIYYPEEVEVYVDGVYAGLTPMSFKKQAGSHTIILKKSGYVTRSYTIYLYDDGEDMSISFSALEKESTSSSSSDTSSTTTSTSSTSSSSSGTSSTTTDTTSTSSGTSTGTDSSTTSTTTDSSTTSSTSDSASSETTSDSTSTSSGTSTGTDSGSTSTTTDSSTTGTTTGSSTDSSTSGNVPDDDET